MKRYLVLAMRRAEFDDGVIAPHLEFLQLLKAEGKLETTGSFSDRSGGAYVLLAEDMDQAQSLVAQDPLTTSGSSSMSVHEWNTR
jgi:uncharacterized protein YciI